MAGYEPPGVNVSLQSQSVSPGLTTGDETILILGESNTFPGNFTDQFKIAGGELSELSREGIKKESILIVKRSSPTIALAKGTDYEVGQVTNSGFVTTLISKKFTAVTNESHEFKVAGTTVNLTNRNLLPGSVVVKNNAGSTTYNEGIDYYVDYVEGRITQVEGAGIPLSEVLKVNYKWATLADSDTLIASYQYTPSDLYDIKSWQNINDIVEFYGPAMSGDTIFSPIALQAQLMGFATVGSLMPEIKTLAVSPTDGSGGNQETIGPDDWLGALANKVSTQDSITDLIS